MLTLAPTKLITRPRSAAPSLGGSKWPSQGLSTPPQRALLGPPPLPSAVGLPLFSCNPEPQHSSAQVGPPTLVLPPAHCPSLLPQTPGHTCQPPPAPASWHLSLPVTICRCPVPAWSRWSYPLTLTGAEGSRSPVPVPPHRVTSLPCPPAHGPFQSSRPAGEPDTGWILFNLPPAQNRRIFSDAKQYKCSLAEPHVNNHAGKKGKYVRQKIRTRIGAPGWLSRLSVRLWLRS